MGIYPMAISQSEQDKFPWGRIMLISPWCCKVSELNNILFVCWKNLDKNSESDRVPSANFHVDQLS